eukprot:276022-Prorocentrum_minimum.AAC.2
MLLQFFKPLPFFNNPSEPRVDTKKVLYGIATRSFEATNLRKTLGSSQPATCPFDSYLTIIIIILITNLDGGVCATSSWRLPALSYSIPISSLTKRRVNTRHKAPISPTHRWLTILPSNYPIPHVVSSALQLAS